MSPSPSGGGVPILGNILGFFGAGRAAGALSDAAYAGEQGILGAAGMGLSDVQNSLAINSPALIGAQNNAINNVQQFGNYGLNLLGGNLGTAEGNINPFIQTGQGANAALGGYAADLPQFGMSPYAGTPAAPAAAPPFGRAPGGGFTPQVRGPGGPGAQPITSTPPGGGPQQFTAPAGSGIGGRAGQFSFAPTMNQLEQTPGYQFARQEGLNAIQNQSSAGGAGMGSNQNLDAAKFATGLASQTYQNAFQNAAQGFGMNQNAFNQTFQNQLGGFGANVGAYNSAFGNALNQFGENQNLRLNTLNSLQGAGLTGSGQANQALLGFGLPAAEQLYNTGLYGGNAIQNTARLNAQQGLAGNEFMANLALPAAQQAGAFALAGAGANANGILQQYNNLAGVGSGLGGLATTLLGG